MIPILRDSVIDSEIAFNGVYRKVKAVKQKNILTDTTKTSFFRLTLRLNSYDTTFRLII